MTSNIKILLAGALSLISVALISGWLGYSISDNAWSAKHSDYKRELAEGLAAQTAQLASAYALAVESSDKVSSELLAAKSRNQKLSQRLSKKVPDVSTVYIETDGSTRPLPSGCFTAGWVRNYNAAISRKLPASGSAGAGPTRAATSITSVGRAVATGSGLGN